MASEELDRLFSVGLAEFVEERGRIARALKDAGRSEEAKALAKTPRPTVPAWVVNQLARREPALVERLGELTARLREAQGRTLRKGEADPEYAATAAAHRQLLVDLRTRAEEILTSAGHTPSPQILKRIVANLRAGAASPDTRALVESGRLSRDIEEQGFGGLFAQAALPGRPEPPAPPPARPGPKGPTRAATPAEEARRRKQAEAAARAQERAAARERAGAERTVERLRAAAATARDALEKQERARAAAAKALAQADERLAAARLEREAASRKLEAAVAELERLGGPASRRART